MAEKAGFYPEFVVPISKRGKSTIWRNDPSKNEREEQLRKQLQVVYF
jgi:hypothetical protein